MILLLFIQDVHCYFLFNFLADFVTYYEEMFFPDTTGAWLILGGSIFITFYGLRYTRISLTPYITAMICYNFLELQQQMDSVSPRTGKEVLFISPEALKSIQAFLNEAVDNPVPLFIVSFVLACIIVWALELLQNIIFMIGLYIIYSMFFCFGFEGYKETNPVLFYALLIISFVILYYLTKSIAGYVFLALFCITGSFVLLSSIELISGTEMGFDNLILDLKYVNSLDFSVTTPAIIWAIVASIGMLWQWKFVGDKI